MTWERLTEVVRALCGQARDAWRVLMPPVRRAAVRLMKQGQLAILRKGKPVDDPEDLRGVYRLGWCATTDVHLPPSFGGGKAEPGTGALRGLGWPTDPQISAELSSGQR